MSRSIDYDEARLQREGTAKALVDPRVVAAIKSGILRRIAVSYLEYSSTPYNAVIVEWTIIDSAESARAVADKLLGAELTFGRRTSISSAIELGIDMIENNEFEGTRRVIDISGDGPNNNGTLVAQARDAAIAKRITINGLPIINDRGGPGSRFSLLDLDKYYQGCVIGGPGAFIVVATDFKDYARAIRRKLIFEIAGKRPTPPPADRVIRVAGPDIAQAPPFGRGFGAYKYPGGCDIGERRWRRTFTPFLDDTN